MKEKIVRIQDKINYFRASNDNGRLAILIRDILEGNAEDFVVSPDYPTELIIDIFTVDMEIREDIKNAISNLICAFLPEFDNLKYVTHLLYLAGRFGVADEKSLMARIQLLSNKEKVVNVYVNSGFEFKQEDVFQLVLRSFIPYIYQYLAFQNPIKESLAKICLERVSKKGQKENPKHLPLCYLFLDKIHTKYSVDYLDSLVSTCINHNFNLLDILEQCNSLKEIADYLLKNNESLHGEKIILILSSLLKLEGLPQQERDNLCILLKNYADSFFNGGDDLKTFVKKMYHRTESDEKLEIRAANLFLYGKNKHNDIVILRNEFSKQIHSYLSDFDRRRLMKDHVKAI